MRKWTEVNIHVSNPNQLKRAILSFVRPFVKYCKRTHQIDSWHFFFEECPLIGPRQGQPEIRLRFYAESAVISQIENRLNTELARLVRPHRNPITFYHFGKHGRPGRYRGERPTWGTDWPVVMKQFNYGSEYALHFLGKTRLHRRLDFHGERYLHLLLNQLLIPHAQAHDPCPPTIWPNRTCVYTAIPQRS